MRNIVEKQLSWLALLMTAFYSLLGSCRSADTSQECGHERLANCARPLERINSNDLSFAITKESQHQLCRELESGIKCIQTYTIDCLDENQREHFNNLYSGTNKAVMELCQDGPYLDEFMKHAGCMQQIAPQYELCHKRYQRITEDVAKNNATDKSVKRLCCDSGIYVAEASKLAVAELYPLPRGIPHEGPKRSVNITRVGYISVRSGNHY
ncbi:uncharacterized protein LOC143357312 isoform X2 [Halictus rubicundus]|uniref:uncharacterized protein LOC143357312 isoform X2 n=1 Tax=Halictus rubicundus TaxID=77578 RepID=UPI004037483B